MTHVESVRVRQTIADAQQRYTGLKLEETYSDLRRTSHTVRVAQTLSWAALTQKTRPTHHLDSGSVRL